MTTAPNDRFVAHEPGTATGRAGVLLDDLFTRHETASSMVRTMAGSPALLSGYLDLSRATKRAGLDRRLGEQVSIAVQALRGCDSCLKAHIEAARHLGVPEHDIQLAQQGTASAPAAASMVDFALQVLVDPGDIDDQIIADLRGQGFSESQLLDVIAIVTVNFLTGTFNLVAGI